jgi:hypothetical protein
MAKNVGWLRITLGRLNDKTYVLWPSTAQMVLVQGREILVCIKFPATQVVQSELSANATELAVVKLVICSTRLVNRTTSSASPPRCAASIARLK